MKRFLFLSIILLGHAALAQPVAGLDKNFQLRVGQANTAARTPRGIQYEQTLAPFVQQAIQACVPPGTIGQGTLGKFIFVANVTSNGAVVAPDVQPKNDVSQCFEARFSQETLSPTPVPPEAKFDYPIVVELNVTP